MIVDKGIKAVGNALKNFAIGLGILILTAFVAIYGMNTFVEEPHYEDYCPDALYNLNDQVSCLDAGGEWEEVAVVEAPDQVRTGNCVAPKACWSEYDSMREDYAKFIFIISVPLGIIIIALGTFVFSLSSVGVGIMLGGVYTLIYGAAGYWQYGANWMRFTISLVALVILVLIAYRFNKPKDNKKGFLFFRK